MNLLNLTPHTVVLHTTDNHTQEIPPSGAVARCAVGTADTGVKVWDTRAGGWRYGGHMPVVRETFGPVEGLPDPAPGTYYLVSRVVAEARRDRADLLVPAQTVRDAAGRIVGCRALATVATPPPGPAEEDESLVVRAQPRLDWDAPAPARATNGASR